MSIIAWAVYKRACSLNAGMGNLGEAGQEQFNASLLQYVIIIVILGIVVGGAIHLYFTRKIIDPIKQLIESTKQIKEGSYPSRLSTRAEGELVDLVDQFNEMVEELERNEYERDKLVTDLSHEIRTPLANLSGYLQALKTGVIQADEQVYNSLLNEANRLKDMMNQLDQLKEWNQDYLGENQERYFNIEEVLEQVISMFSLQLKEKKISLVKNIENKRLKGYETGIEQAFTNILANAIQYYQGDGAIKISASAKNQAYTVTVSGPGKEISAEDRKDIFKRFYRVESSRNRETGGSGLGLAIAKEIIHYHGGKIHFQSKNDQNKVTFTIAMV